MRFCGTADVRFSVQRVATLTGMIRALPNTSQITAFALWCAASLLALDPLQWLVGTWYQAGYEGIGWVACLAVAVLAGCAIRAPVSHAATRSVAPTYVLLTLTAVLRLASQLLDVDVIGALLLAVDVYALARLARLDERKFAVSPLWLAVLFCFSLPVEPMVQRVIGFDLQQISAVLACGMLMPFFQDLACEGIRLRLADVDVLVDLPCSGAEIVSISAFVFSLINSVQRPDLKWSLLSSAACVVLALMGNGLRIGLLAVGIAHADVIGFSVMDPLPHTLIGLVVVALTSTALLAMTRFYPTRDASAPVASTTHPPSTLERPLPGLVFALSLVLFALLVGAIQPRPVDASPTLAVPEMPWVAAGFLRESAPLTDQEQTYFTRYGGGADRAAYGPYGLLLVSTASPLRHLHDPLICLRGAGLNAHLLGTDHEAGETVYRASDAARSYLVRVAYRSDEGQQASSVSEVVWHWLRQPGTTWTMVQQVIPEDAGLDAGSTVRWQAAVRRAFNLT